MTTHYPADPCHPPVVAKTVRECRLEQIARDCLPIILASLLQQDSDKMRGLVERIVKEIDG